MSKKMRSPFFFEKSPQHPHHWAALDLMLQWADATELNVRFIGMVRNPMAVMYSAMNLFATDPSKRQFGWAHCYRNILAFKDVVGEDRFYLIRYEDLVKQPQKILEDACRFIGVDATDSIGASIHPDALTKWRSDPTFTLRLHPSVYRIAHHFKYQMEDVYNPPKPVVSGMVKLQNDLLDLFKRTKMRLLNRIKRTRLVRKLFQKGI